MDQAPAKRVEQSDNATTSYFQRGKKLCDAVYSFHEPEGILEIEIVFIHGLQLAKDYFEDAYWRAWLARDGTEDNCWPMTWLPKKFPNARILSLSYDACAWRTPTTGRMDAYLLGETLVQLMTSREVGIGQKGCPVVFVCHSLGGLIAKQIVVRGQFHFSKKKEVRNLLGNLKAFFFYATPHGGSKLANLAGCIPFLSTSPLVKYLQIMNEEVGRLNSEFEQIHRDVGRRAWKFYVVGETHPTSYLRLFSAMVVEEASVRRDYPNFISLAANHIDVCKPENETDSGFQHLTRCIREVAEEHKKMQGCLLELPGRLFGIEEKLQEIQKKMALHSIVSLVGMGGIGKTTLSKDLYNREKRYIHGRNRFERFCFLEDVRSRGNEACRRQLFRDLCSKKWDENEDEGVQLETIKQCIVTMRVLLVIDNVGVEKDMKDLFVHAFKDGLKGSKVIVTTRRRDSLHDYREGIFDVELLNEKDASNLFLFYAFHGVDDDEERMQLDDHAKAIIKACGQLPLSLEVIGQYLRKYNSLEIGERIDVWEEALRRLQEAKPFDGHIDDEKLWGIVRKMVDGSMSWLWKKEEGLKFTLQNISFKTIEGLLLIHVKKSEFDQHQDLTNRSRDIGGASYFKKLRLLDLRDSDLQVVEHYVQLCSEELTWLCLDRTKITVWSIRELASFTKLRVLEMNNCKNLEEIPLSIENLSLLKELQLCYCTSLKTLPDTIGNLKSLQVLMLEHCSSLESLPTSISRLDSLKRLNCTECKTLTGVPTKVGKVKKLEYLMFAQCFNLKTICIFEAKMHHLYELDLTWCFGLETIKFLGNLHCLKALRLCYNEKLCIDNLPEQLGQLSQLEHLDLCRCKRLEKVILETIQKGQLRTNHLEVLHLSVFPNSELPPCPRLKYLGLENYNQVENLPESLGNLSHMEDLLLLELSNSLGLKVLPDALCKLEQLTNLQIAGFYMLERLPKHMGHLSSLRSLWITDCVKLVELPSSLGDISQLQHLHLRNCRSLERLPESLVRLTQLSRLFILSCNNLQLWESDQSSILQQLKDAGCIIHALSNREKNIALLQMIDAGTDRHVIAQFVKEVQSQPSPKRQTIIR